MGGLDRAAASKRSVVGAVGTAAVLVACCLLAPLALGIAGAMAIGLEVATIAAVVLAVVLVARHRRSCDCATVGPESAPQEPTREEV